MHRKSLEAQEVLREDSGVSDHEESIGSKSNDELRRLTSSTESLNVVSPVPSSLQQHLSPATTPTVTTTSSSPHIDLSSPPPTPHQTTSPPNTQVQPNTYAHAQHTAPIAPSYHPLLDAANASATANSNEFHMIMNNAVAAAAAAVAAAETDNSSLSPHHLQHQHQQEQRQAAHHVVEHRLNNSGAMSGSFADAYGQLETDPDAFRNNSIACLRAKAQEHQARLLNSGFLLQMRSMAELQNSSIACGKHSNDTGEETKNVMNGDAKKKVFDFKHSAHLDIYNNINNYKRTTDILCSSATTPRKDP